MSGDEESYEEHVLQNNTRLVGLAANLREPQNFPSACTELTQWCSDPRAYTPHFEENLLAALQICVENGTKDGFDFTLAHQLITCCFQHRKLLSKESATRINRWYEQYRRIKKNGGKRKRKTEMPPIDPGGLEQITVTDSGCTSMWPQGGPMPGAAQLTSPGYPGQMMMPGYPPQQGAFPPMDPTGARPGYPEGFTHEQMMQHQQRMMQMHQMQQRQAAAAQAQRRAAMMPQQGYPDASQMYPPIPMGANSVPGQSGPLVRMPSQGPAYPGMTMPGAGRPMPSPVYPQGANHQMIKASPPVLFSNLQQQQPQSQAVMSYPNPHALPPPYQEMPPVMIPLQPVLVAPFSPPDGMHHYVTHFTISQEVWQMAQNPQYNLQLKGWNQEDSGIGRPQWPLRPGSQEIAIQISINGKPVLLAKDRCSPVKNFIIQGENKLEIQSMQLPVKQYYTIQLVTIMHFGTFVDELLRRHQRSGWNSEFFKSRLISKGNGNAVVVGFNDARTGKRMRYPARSIRCRHTNAFELVDLLFQHFECSQLICPVQGCNTQFAFTEIELDSFVADVIRQATNSTATQVIIDPTGAYRLSDDGEVNRKRSSVEDGSVHSLKRIKSEQFPSSSASPFPSVNSVPGGMPLGQSPANMMSPFGNNISPKKEIMSPVGANVGSGTPGPNIKEEPREPLPSAATLTSPHGLVPVVNNGSVDSANGSAPYTPASMNGQVPNQTQQAEPQNVSLTTLENDILEPFRPAEGLNIHSPIEICKYLQDGDFVNGKCHGIQLSNRDLGELVEILNSDAMKTWGMSLSEIARQFTPLLI